MNIHSLEKRCPFLSGDGYTCKIGLAVHTKNTMLPRHNPRLYGQVLKFLLEIGVNPFAVTEKPTQCRLGDNSCEVVNTLSNLSGQQKCFFEKKLVYPVIEQSWGRENND